MNSLSVISFLSELELIRSHASITVSTQLNGFKYCKYVVPSISFQTFCVHAFKIVVDSWKFSMLFLYILWDDFRFKWTATAAIGIHPTKSWLSQLGNFRNVIWTLEERYAIKFCFKFGKMPCNESWIYCYDPETKRQSSQWKHAGSPRLKKERLNKSTHKLLMIPFFLTALAWSTWTGFPLERQSTRNTTLRS